MLKCEDHCCKGLPKWRGFVVWGNPTEVSNYSQHTDWKAMVLFNEAGIRVRPSRGLGAKRKEAPHMPHCSPGPVIQMENAALVTKVHPGHLLWLSLCDSLELEGLCQHLTEISNLEATQMTLSCWRLPPRANQQINQQRKANEIFFLIKCNDYNSVFHPPCFPSLLPLHRRQRRRQ